MAEAFLRRLLQNENRVPSDEEQKCIICLEECGTMNPETGLLELAIRLPFCRHIVGSGCIAQWLRSNNTCPMCRHVFFPAQSRPYLEHGIMEGQTDRVQTNRAQTVRGQIFSGPVSGVLDYLGEIGHLCDRYCTQLGLRPGIAHLAKSVFANLVEPGSANAIIQPHGDDCVIAVSIYIASHLAGHPRCSPEISTVMDDVGFLHIRNTYNLLTDRSWIADHGIRDELNEDLNVQTLTWPPHGDELTARESALAEVLNHCSLQFLRLGLSVPYTMFPMAQNIASRAWNIASLHETRRSPQTLAAACMYMAGYLVGSFPRLSRISRVSEVSEEAIAEVYGLLRAERERIVRERWLQSLWRQDQAPPGLEWALRTLPTL
ncbi:MAG: hypothetical protein ASARMPRED_001251 [Alectoria sarmentosa]|nr:MAG: hypothetical protein ASARMPRED_001251 [Alectoria sarmentosa]